jgi:RecJ-like exonuclease
MEIDHFCGRYCSKCRGTGEPWYDARACTECHGRGYFGRGDVVIHVDPELWRLPDEPVYCEVCGKDLKESHHDER